MMTSRERRLPRRDYVILPLLSLATVLLLALGGELASRWFFEEGAADACLLHDPVLGVRHKPDCAGLVKVPESEWVTNSYNSCGYRTTEDCRPAPPGTLRIALVGSSIAFGLYVPYPQSIAAALGDALTRACGQPVQVQNLASEFEFWSVLRRRFDLALALKPDAVIAVAGPTDIETPDPDLAETQNALPPAELLTRIRNLFTNSRLRVVAQHFMYRDAGFYLSLYRNSLAKTLYMRAPLAPTLQTHVKAYGELLGQLALRARVTDVPVMLAYVPQRAQVGFAADAARPASIDPFALDNALRQAAADSSVSFDDTTPDFVRDPRQMDLFLRSDGHLDSQGDGVIARSLARAAMRDFAAFRHCAAGGQDLSGS